MKKILPILGIICLLQYSAFSQLTVTATAANPNICLTNSTAIEATATPVGYTVTAIANNPIPLQGINYLADAGIAITPLTVGNLDDGRWDNITLPFTFTFYGNAYNAVNVSTNGWVGLGSTNTVTTGFNFALPAASAPNNVIHAITADLNFKPATTSSLEYFEDGSWPNRSFVINFGSIKFFSGGGTANVQVILYEGTNVIEIHTSDCSNTTLAKAQGIENSTGTAASVVPGRNNTTNWSATGMPNAYRFTPDNITFTWSPATGLNTTTGANVIASPTTSTTYTINALNTVNSATGSTTVTINIDPASFTLAGVAGGPQICQNISVSGGGTYYRDGNCNLIASIIPFGASPVSNSVNTCTQIAANSYKRGTTDLFAARKYDMEPIVNPSTSTAKVVLYYTQAEFNDFNTRCIDSGHKFLPVSSGDAVGIGNLVIRQYHGVGTAPGNYSGPGAPQDFTTATAGFTVIWNATRSWWEVTVPITGFSGFYLTSKKASTLAIGLEYFKGVQVDKKNLLKWKVNCTSAEAKFEILRSADGQHYTPIGAFTASQLRCGQPFDYTDEKPLSGANYYRIRIIDVDGKDALSNIIQLTSKTSRFEMISLNPSMVSKENATLKVNADEKNQLNIVITDFSGRRISTQTLALQPGINQTYLNTANLASGVYQVTGYFPGEKAQTLRFIKHD